MTRVAAVMVAVFLGAGAVVVAQDPPAPIAPVAPLPPPFSEWLTAFRAEAAQRGIRPEVLERAFDGVEPVEQILERDRSQAEFTLNLESYLKRRLTRGIVRTGQQMYSQHRSLLAKVGEKYGVSPRVVVAVWGLESNFGRFAGVRPTIPTLATLAYDQRRGSMFRNELFSALEIVNRGDIELERLKGSWAGALGQPQFMPSSYLQFAEDFDGDGRRDIWASEPDVFASVANFLKQHGWTKGESWGREVTLTGKARTAVDRLPVRAEGCRAERAMTDPLPLKTWRQMGVKIAGGALVPATAREASLLRAGTRNFLLYSNYGAILSYNCAHTYALSVALLSDQLH
ncbi:MAG: lytic murein transglycosylase [Acidobacteria bacterium]|nr:lytic murein transglycosylase [Acidobacteriota bacterium]